MEDPSCTLIDIGVGVMAVLRVIVELIAMDSSNVIETRVGVMVVADEHICGEYSIFGRKTTLNAAI